ncbi:MAG TPA: PsiF family protein [Luteibacter sp.]|jgi:hypothetical protein|nr:PsiF family protein [Luteibacter sp.]
MHLRLRLMAATALFLLAGAAFAAPQAAKKELTPQQQRMSTCSTQSAGKKGDDRKAFMSSCLKGDSAAPAPKMTQQQKMTACNKDAGTKALKGDARKTFMSSCLKG